MDPIPSKRHPGALSAWLPAALWLAAMLLVSVQSVAVTREMLSMVAGAAKGIMGAMVKDGLSAETADLVGKVACAGVVFLGYAVLALLLLRALRLRGTGPRAAYGLSLSGCVLFAVVAELFQVLIPGRQPTVGECALNIAASFVTLLCAALFWWMWRRFPKLVNRETVSYVIFGVLTTVVNIVSYLPLYKLLLLAGLGETLANVVSNTTAWVLAVLFAYATNKIFVFQSKTGSMKAALREFALFVGARAASYVVDMGGMLLLVNLLHVHNAVAKILTNILVVIINYFFSKWFIFNRDAKQPPEKTAEKTADGSCSED